MLEEKVFEEGLVGREGDLECRLKLSNESTTCGGKNLTSMRRMNLLHKQLDAPDQTCQSTQKRDTFQARSTCLVPT